MSYWIWRDGKSIGPFDKQQIIIDAHSDELISHGDSWLALQAHPDFVEQQTRTKNMEFTGHNGQIEIDDQWLTIKRKGGLALITQGLKGDKRILIANILSVQFKSASSLTNGYIQFSTAAGESGGGVFSATRDENSVMFKKTQEPEFVKLRDHLENLIATRQNATPAAPVAEVDVAEQLKKFAELRDQGILTEEEFQAQKAKLLSR